MTRRIAVALAFVLLLVPSFSYAGGPLAVCRPGVPYTWPNGGTDIPWNPDQGTLGPLTNAQAISLVGLAFSRWDAIPTASTTYAQGAALPADVTLANFLPYFLPSAPDSQSAIVFDSTGEIFDLIFGEDSGVLGFAGPEWLDPENCTIAEGVAFLNGAAVGVLQEALDIMVHEFGHYQNLDHTVVNGQIVIGDTTGPTPDDTFPVTTLVNLIETMYPFYFGPAAGMSTPDKDDVAALSMLYPAPSFAETTGTIRGRVFSTNGRVRKSGVNVIARNMANPFADAVSAITSNFTDDYRQGKPLVGAYALRGLTPGAQYAIYIDYIFAGEFTPPLQTVPAGAEEFYNGRREGTLATGDDPLDLEPVTVGAGRTVGGVDITFNGFAADEPLPLSDDSAVELSTPFTFTMCGRNFDEVIVNANGSLTFGAPAFDFTPSGAELLSGPPRIAGLWNDYNPLAGGSVFFTPGPWNFKVTFSELPIRTGPTTGVGSNTFAISLKRFFDQIDVEYGEMTARTGVAGVSCGGAITSGFETPSDLSELAERFRINLLFQPAVYEVFTEATATAPEHLNDLANRTLHYTPTTDYSDFLFEPNNTLAQAHRIRLPFDSIPVIRFTEIGKPGDVDFYRFRANAGDHLIAETLSGQLDTVLGLFNRETGEMLAVDDDSGAGVLSRIEFDIPEAGEYAIAVSTFPDFGFEGVGTETGRYVLSVRVQAETTEAPLAMRERFNGLLRK